MHRKIFLLQSFLKRLQISLELFGSLCRVFSRVGLVGLVCLTLFSCDKFQPGIGYNKGHSPVQPLPFDHSLHAGQYQIKCMYCHNQVERSKASNIPALSTCMNCHIQVKTDSPFIAKIREAYTKGGSIEWVRVHMLPDHVMFNHSAHVQKGVSCNTCHGPVDTMKQVTQFSDLSMGWCVNCHRKPENNAPLNCSTCHH